MLKHPFSGQSFNGLPVRELDQVTVGIGGSPSQHQSPKFLTGSLVLIIRTIRTPSDREKPIVRVLNTHVMRFAGAILPSEAQTTESPRWSGLSRSARDVQPRMSLSSPQRHSPVARILSKQILESNQRTSQSFLRQLFFDPGFNRFCIVIFPATVLTFSQSRQRVNA